jgi:MYXO-CTERM domain-containing protein
LRRHSPASALLLAGLVAVAFSWACDRAAPTPTGGSLPLSRFSGDGPTAAELHLAAAEMHVPVEVLAAAAFSESRFVFRDAEGGESSGRGLFQLDDWAIGEAAVGLHETPERVAAEPITHARGFAWLLFRGAAEHGDVPAEDDVQAWVPHVADVRANLAAGRALVDGVAWALDRGFSVTVGGEHLALEPDVFGRIAQANRPDQPGVAYVQSVNYRNDSRGRGEVDTVVVHVTQGSYGGTISWFQNPDAQVSSHYVVRSADGEITQMVEEEDIAWHASCWNGRSVGIEHEGFVDDPAWFTEEMYRSSAALTRSICERWGIPMDREHIRGHVELSDCNDHTDPGPNWDWDHYIALVRGEPAPAPTGGLIGFVRAGDLHNEAAPIADARVAVTGGPEVRSGADGLYQIDGLTPGHYAFTISAPGYRDEALERDVAAGAQTWGSVGLQPEAAMPPPSAAPDAALDAATVARPADARVIAEPPIVDDDASPAAAEADALPVLELDAASVTSGRWVETAPGDDAGCRTSPGPAAPLALLVVAPIVWRRRRSVRDSRSAR